MLACPPVKGSRLQRVVLFFFFFSSRFYSLSFFFLFEQNLLCSRTRVCVCSFCVLCLAAAMTDQTQFTYVSPLCCLLLLVFFFFIIILIPSSSKRKKRKNEWLFFFLFTQTNNVDSFSITNIFYHLIYQLVYAIQFSSYFNLS